MLSLPGEVCNWPVGDPLQGLIEATSNFGAGGWARKIQPTASRPTMIKRREGMIPNAIAKTKRLRTPFGIRSRFFLF
jgi:hypothetical protein